MSSWGLCRSCDSWGVGGGCEKWIFLMVPGVCVAVNTDCLLHMALYDENLLKNPFYVALEKQRPDLCSRVAEVHGVVSLRCCWSRRVQTRRVPSRCSVCAQQVLVCLQVLVPCCSSLVVSSFPDSQFDSYVLQPVEDGFQTLDGKVGSGVRLTRTLTVTHVEPEQHNDWSMSTTTQTLWVCDWTCCRESRSRTDGSSWAPGFLLWLRSPSCLMRPSTTTRSRATASSASPGP